MLTLRQRTTMVRRTTRRARLPRPVAWPPNTAGRRFLHAAPAPPRLTCVARGDHDSAPPPRWSLEAGGKCSSLTGALAQEITMAQMETPFSRLQQLKLYYEKNEHAFDIAAFVGGFLFDIAMLDRIDAWSTIGQQAAYLALIGVILLQMFFAEGKPAPALNGMPVFKRWYYEYRVALVHFLLGTLLNLYTLFFFKSSSLIVSFAFMGVLVLLLVANDSKRMKAIGLSFKFALFSLCLLSFCAAIVPVLVGSMGLFVFMLSMLTACVPLAVIYRRIRIHAP